MWLKEEDCLENELEAFFKLNNFFAFGGVETSNQLVLYYIKIEEEKWFVYYFY